MSVNANPSQHAKTLYRCGSRTGSNYYSSLQMLRDFSRLRIPSSTVFLSLCELHCKPQNRQDLKFPTNIPLPTLNLHIATSSATPIDDSMVGDLLRECNQCRALLFMSQFTNLKKNRDQSHSACHFLNVASLLRFTIRPN